LCDFCYDKDNDGYGDPGFPLNTCQADNCPKYYNPDQMDHNNNGIGDLCESGWSCLGDQFGGVVLRLLVHDGMLIAGGEFGSWSGDDANNIAFLDGLTWKQLGSDSLGGVYSLGIYQNQIVASGCRDFPCILPHVFFNLMKTLVI